ncbi:HAD family hydrolase [Edaphobacter aggregans]|uniref:HAD family hydrolase n=1 Tax=Edaphobacter aggregans TaxID=570835 RepID=UPI000550EC12|nr:beta-phosphoglucomutase family hydrolase [Edaphobacter aggregans]
MMSFPEITRENFDAVLFDLDGVLTATAKLHAVAWKQTFDEYLKHRAETRKETFVPFDIGEDYRQYIDGKPRFDGVQSFLASRGIELPYGKPNDPPTAETICGIGNKKNELVNEIMEREGVEAYPGSVRAVNYLKERGFKTAVVSSSNNCAAVLKAARIESLFDVRVDGRTAADLHLAGKPEPDTFLEADRQLGVEARRSIVVEDALAGVQAGKRGGFGLVIGVARTGNADALKKQGADLVVGDLAELLPPVEGR